MKQTRPKRIGAFRIGRDLVDEKPEWARAILADMIVVRCELSYASDAFEYFALSNSFDEIEPGLPAPSYECSVKEVWTTGCMRIIVEWKRQ